jgi:uncharacterized Zn finger protein
MPTPPEIDYEHVARWVGSVSLDRAYNYVGDAFSNLRRTGNTLKGDCQGTSPIPYRVEATLGKRGIARALCSCPVGDEGRCKHVAALLLTWIEDPHAFEEVPELMEALEQRTKPELIALIRMMLARHPDLESVLNMPPPGSSAKPVDHKVIQKQVRKIRKSYEYGEWGSGRAAAQELGELVRLGDVYREGEDWNNAATIYETLISEILDHYDDFYDEEGEIISVIHQCVEGLGEVLGATFDPARREEILRLLFDVYLKDINYGGIGMGDAAYEQIVDLATPEEKQRVVQWVRDALPKHTRLDSWHREAMGGFILELEAETMDDEKYLRICRETGRDADLITRLLELGRVEEARENARQVQGFPLIQLLNIFVTHGQGEVAENIVREQLTRNPEMHLLEWMKQRAEQEGYWAEGLAVM